MVDRRIIRFTRIKSSPRSKKIRNIRERIVESSQCFRAESRNTQRYEGGINCKKGSPLVVSVLPFGIMDFWLIFHFHPWGWRDIGDIGMISRRKGCEEEGRIGRKY